jgi:hypothetical protein
MPVLRQLMVMLLSDKNLNLSRTGGHKEYDFISIVVFVSYDTLCQLYLPSNNSRYSLPY